jgi:dTDP-4-dehydrorhamnose 3,5-epimerase-like enzyme
MEARLIEIEYYNQAARGMTEVFEIGGLPIPRIARVFVVSGVKSPTVQRGGHAHKTCHQILACISGRVNVTVRKVGNENKDQVVFTLTENFMYALYVPPGFCIDMNGFTPDSKLMVLCSEPYDNEDFIPCGEVIYAHTN